MNTVENLTGLTGLYIVTILDHSRGCSNSLVASEVFRTEAEASALIEHMSYENRTYNCHMTHVPSSEQIAKEYRKAVHRAMYKRVRMLDENGERTGSRQEVERTSKEYIAYIKQNPLPPKY